MDREMAMHNLRGLWKRLRKEEHERQPPHERPGLKQPPLPVPESEEHLDAQGLEPIGLEGRPWGKTVGPADNLPYQHGRLVDPSGPADGKRWPSDNFLTLQIRTLWAPERAERTFAKGLDVAEPARFWLTGERDKRFSGLHDSPQRAPDDKGRCVRYVSLYTPVDPTPKPPDRGTHLTLPDDTAVLPDLPQLQPEEMREMEMVLRSYWQTEARAPHGDERFKGPALKKLQALGFQAEKIAGRVSWWGKMEGQLGRDRTLVDRPSRGATTCGRRHSQTLTWTRPSSRTELVTKQGNRVYVVKWTPELTRPAPTQGAAGDRPSGDAEEGPPLIWTREPSPGVGPLGPAPSSTAQAGGSSSGRGRAEAAVSRAETGPTTRPAPTSAAGQVTVRQVLNESLAQATQQLTAALPTWATASNGVAQLQALMQDVLARAEAQRPGITNRAIPWTSPSSPRDEHFPPALYVGAPGEYVVGGADPTPLLSLAEPAARAMLARRLSHFPAHTGTRLNERVRAPIFNTGAREIWVNGKPLEGIAILDTGASRDGADGVDGQGCCPQRRAPGTGRWPLH
jgi:hypothetical protein